MASLWGRYAATDKQQKLIPERNMNKSQTKQEQDKKGHTQKPGSGTDQDWELFNADPGCDHNIVCASGGGVKCTKCSGWFCY